MSEPLTFADLSEGDYFIAFPVDGDDSGHGGYRAGSYVFKKMRKGVGRNDDAFRLTDGSYSMCPDTMPVLKVLL